MEVNVSEKMSELVNILKKGFNGYRISLYPSCKDSWSKDYAICEGYLLESRNGFGFEEDDYHRFDEDRLYDDFGKFVLNHFGGATEIETEDSDVYRSLESGSVVVLFRQGCQEMEVYRKQ